ncbi:MAG TPA: hypothetical protein VFY06_01435 [Verrucomicrobiae bacterium]|nr:hypothetical protein [Verrucomicrobiae bacterium]
MTPFVRLWIWISAFATLAGWGLSVVGQLNRPGYAVAIIIFAVFMFLRRKDLGFAPTGNCSRRKRILRRFRRPLPLAFAILSALIFLGGAIYPPTHWNAVAYHMPRVLHWLEAGRWNWIHTAVERMNYSGCDFEWLLAPLLLFTRSDRTLFLLNFIPFLLIPGLVFSLFTRLGVRTRVAWYWMWLFPTGYILLLQAGSAGNDAISVIYALAAMDFGFRAGKSRRARDLWVSVLAAALMTGTKPVSLPLLLPWTILMVTSGAWRITGKFPARAANWLSLAVAATMISFFPIALMNKIHSGDWLGTSLEGMHLEMEKPLIGVVGNVFQLALQNFTPPLFPLAGWWNHHCPELLPQSWIAAFQPGFASVGELPNEDWSGIGFCLSVLLAASVAANFLGGTGRRLPATNPTERHLPSDAPGRIEDKFRWLLLLAPWVSLLFFCTKSAMNTPCRLIAPYYPLLLPSLLLGAGQTRVVRRWWWRALAGLAVMLAFVVLILSPDRPLWPAKPILSRLAAQHASSHLIARALDVYTVYSHRSDPLADLRPLLPDDPKIVGFVGGPDDPEISLWRPFGSRRVEDFRWNDPPERYQQEGIQCAVLGGLNLQAHGVTLDDWLKKTGAELVATTNATLKVSEGPEPWFVVRFKP